MTMKIQMKLNKSDTNVGVLLPGDTFVSENKLYLVTDHTDCRPVKFCVQLPDGNQSSFDYDVDVSLVDCEVNVIWRSD